MEFHISTAPQSNRYFLKGLITGGLILLMLIPAVFVSSLIDEREMRQQEVVSDISKMWSCAQTLSGPFLYVPYTMQTLDSQGKPVLTRHHFWILPENLQVEGSINHQVRQRSIYKVLLYEAGVLHEGNFIIRVPEDVDTNAIQWSEIKICYGLSDFRGIAERMVIRLDGADHEFSPGIPANELMESGVSASVDLQADDLSKAIRFRLDSKIRGTGQLHFVPLSGNSSYELRSAWHSPSFDGNSLPGERVVTDSGFHAKWVFNKANLPFGTVLKNAAFDVKSFAFGVTMIQPVDHYAKAQRTVKYSFLIIGLTFSLFFIVEIMQRKPVHPVQYVLIGLALVIFYTLLLSISEFISFDPAYGIAAAATILLIAGYAKSHFGSWRSSGLFGGILFFLYGFIFILIRLEDTALLVGSIGLFVILALAMYGSRKVNWYGERPGR